MNIHIFAVIYRDMIILLLHVCVICMSMYEQFPYQALTCRRKDAEKLYMHSKKGIDKKIWGSMKRSMESVDQYENKDGI